MPKVVDKLEEETFSDVLYDSDRDKNSKVKKVK